MLRRNLMIAILLLLMSVTAAARQTEVEYGEAGELRGVAKLYVSTGVDMKARESIVKELREWPMMNMSNEEMAMRYVERFQSAVAGDGFEGFFRGEAGDYAQATLNALLVVGAVDAAALLRRAMWVFEGGTPPREQAARREELSQIGEAERALLRRLDESFRRGNGAVTRALTEYFSLEEPRAAS